MENVTTGIAAFVIQMSFSEKYRQEVFSYDIFTWKMENLGVSFLRKDSTVRDTTITITVKHTHTHLKEFLENASAYSIDKNFDLYFVLFWKKKSGSNFSFVKSYDNG